MLLYNVLAWCFTGLPLASAMLERISLANLAPSITDDQVCNPDSISIRFTGIRVYQAVLYGWPVRHFWYVAECESGAVVTDQYFPANRSGNFPFTEPVCLGDGNCYAFARRKKYAERDMPIFKPMTYIGMLYHESSSSNETTDIVPKHAGYNHTVSGKFTAIGSLTSDNLALAVIVPIDMWHNMNLVPIMHASLPRGDASQDHHKTLATKIAEGDINAIEDYEYTADDRKTLWHKINGMLNTLIGAAELSDKLVFWEFDPVEKQAKSTKDWRVKINKVLQRAS